ncbi:hypothetical protein VMCG_05953 [Cytospora schulzeri]|uniref:DUF6699 domain-containing protein n=1 Tax=Cytospora schulzeri TaxID=448051 RepID=A0A423WD21_9PEZI|nr:hypothetical protein VMCG_05953 [Valsa malicola]
MTEPLAKVDSAIDGLDTHHDVKGTKKPRMSSVAAPGVWNVKDLGMIFECTLYNGPSMEQKIDLKLAPETQKTGWKVNTSPSTVEDKEILKTMLTEPPIKKIDLHFPLGLEVTARNLKGVTIKDALDAIHKQFKKRASLPSATFSVSQQDDELEKPYLAGFEWDPEESWTRLVVHLQSHSGVPPTSGKKKNKKHEE